MANYSPSGECVNYAEQYKLIIMQSIKVRSLVSTMALFTPTHFFAYNGNRHEDI